MNNIFFVLFVFNLHSQSENKLEIYNKLINELRCLVCQNQSIAESNAPFAVDIKYYQRKINNGESKSNKKLLSR